ncbi:MAG: trypsin-like peptidase domain-containing protein [Candidatus Merdousia sp.]|nr:trypsin-like peptidase domain-containing protein [Candidatus Merdousia sp.]
MFRRAATLLFALLPTACALLCASCASGGDANSAGFENLLESVVKIDVWEVSQKDGGSRTNRAVGSGAIMSEDGTILTNAHVVNCYASKIVVTLANLERVRAEFVGWDHWTDLAVIRLDPDELKRKNPKFAVAKLGDSDTLRAGEVVYAVGTPHGFARTITRGIISNTNRYFEGTILNSGYETGAFNSWIQTDAAINPGNSGGPLVRPNGEIVGINTRAYTNSNNLGFSVPSNVARRVINEISAHGKVERGYVGIGFAPLQDMEEFFEIDTNRGVLVQNVDALSPAAVAGILAGDIVLKIDGEDIDGRFPEQMPAIMAKIADVRAGGTIELELLRGGKKFSKTLKAERLESRIGKEYTLEKWGAGMREITKPYARESKLDTDSRLMVAGVRQGFPFDAAGICAGDIIVSADRKKVSTEAELRAVYESYCKSPKKILVEILRDRALSFHILAPPEN